MVSEDNRDTGKTFVIREMPADQAEWWAARALLALTNAGADLPDGVRNGGMAGFAVAGLQALQSLAPEIIKPLMDEMFECIKYQHDPRHPLQAILPGDESQIEEVVTRMQLRKAVLELHVGFSLGDLASTTGSPPSTQNAPA